MAKPCGASRQPCCSAPSARCTPASPSSASSTLRPTSRTSATCPYRLSPVASTTPSSTSSKTRLRELPGWKEWDVSGSVVANLDDHSYHRRPRREPLVRQSFFFLHARGGAAWQQDIGLWRSALQHGHLDRSAIPAMSPIRNSSTEASGDRQTTLFAHSKPSCRGSLDCRPPLRSSLQFSSSSLSTFDSPHIGTTLLSSFLYSMLIGFPSALSLNWIGFHYTKRFPRLVFAIYAAALFATATCGCWLALFSYRSPASTPQGIIGANSSIPSDLPRHHPDRRPEHHIV